MSIYVDGVRREWFLTPFILSNGRYIGFPLLRVSEVPVTRQ